MGATLGCFRGGPDPDVDVMATHYLHGGVHGTKRCSSYAALQTGSSSDRSVLDKLQRTFSLSLLRSRSEASSSSSARGGSGSSRSYRGSTINGSSSGRSRAKDITGARSSRDDDVFEPGSWSHSRSHSSASGTSGSRMLSDFYNLVLEAERSSCFRDKHGKRVKGAYLDDVRIIDDYFAARRRRGGAVAATSALRHAMLEPKLSLLERYAHVPTTALMSTSSTISSELDYWSCLDSLATDYDDVDKPALRRRYDSMASMASASAAAMNGLLLYSPMHADNSSLSLSTSLSPRSGWTGMTPQFVDEADEADDDDDGSDNDDDVGSRSATYGYAWDQLVDDTQDELSQSPSPRHSSLYATSPASPSTAASLSSSSKTRSDASRDALPPIYFTPDAARNERAVAPMMAS